jgi:phosphoribosylglycinamide formyltransferase-1
MRTIILGSGKGSNCKAILDASTSGLLGSAEIVGVCSDKKESGILEVARSASVPDYFLGNYDKSKDDPWIEKLTKLKPDLIVLAGFMRVLSKTFIDSFSSKIINLHPSLLPSFRGLHAIEQAWNAGVKITGCTVHWISAELDSGEIIAQAPVRIMFGDTLDSVAAKIHAAEHMLLPTVISQLSQKVSSNE